MSTRSPKAENLIRLMREAKIRPSEIASRLNLPPQNVNNWRIRSVPGQYSLAVAEMLGCDPADISDHPVLPPTTLGAAVRPERGSLGSTVREAPATYTQPPVPLISWVSAGTFCEAIDTLAPGDAEDWITFPVRHSPQAFCLQVIGRSMEPDYREGEVILVDPDVPAEHNDDVVARTPDGGATFKRLQITPEGTFLLAINPDYPDRIIRAPEGTAICGVVTASWQDRRKNKARR